MPVNVALPEMSRRAELAADAVVHGIGIAAAVIGAGALIVIASVKRNGLELATVTTYSFGLLAMLICSTVYNMAERSRYRELLRRFDHAAIFVMIAGTYTPFTVLAFPEPWSSGLTIAVWTAAAAGVAFKLWRPLRWQRLSVALYLVMGWIGLVALDPFLRSLATPTLVLLLAGGVVYSAGVVFHVARHRYQNAVWHGCVLVAACTHYAAVFSLVA